MHHALTSRLEPATRGEALREAATGDVGAEANDDGRDPVSEQATAGGRLRADAVQFLKFALVGASGVVVNLAVFSATLLVWLALTGHIHSTTDLMQSSKGLVTKSAQDIPRLVDYVANALGFAVSVMTNYYLNRRWTFRSTGRVASELPKFVAVSLIAYAGNLAVFSLARTQLGPVVSQLIAIAVVMPVNYVANKLWSFRHVSREA
jgi:putative flippase GtrA